MHFTQQGKNLVILLYIRPKEVNLKKLLIDWFPLLPHTRPENAADIQAST